MWHWSHGGESVALGTAPLLVLGVVVAVLFLLGKPRQVPLARAILQNGSWRTCVLTVLGNSSEVGERWRGIVKGGGRSYLIELPPGLWREELRAPVRIPVPVRIHRLETEGPPFVLEQENGRLDLIDVEAD